MSPSILKRTRIIITAIIGVFCFLLVISNTFNEFVSNLGLLKFDGLINLSLGIILGGFISFLYEISNIRNLVWRPYTEEMGDYINNRLFSISGIPSFPLANVDKKVIKSRYFKFIDSDTFLGNTSQRIMVNGVIFTGIIDACTLSILTMYILLIKLIVMGFPFIAMCIIILILISTILIWSLYLVKARHFELMDEQLDYIEKSCDTDCIKKILIGNGVRNAVTREE